MVANLVRVLALCVIFAIGVAAVISSERAERGFEGGR